MFRKNLAILFSISLFVVLGEMDANAYFFSATDGLNILLLEATPGSNGKLAVTSEFEYAAPGRMGSTALIPSPKSTTDKLVFDLFGTFDAPGKPVVFRDHLEYDVATKTWHQVSRKIFRTHKLDSYNLLSGSASETERLLLTENGSLVNRRVVTPTGKLKGKNKATFKNPKNFDPLSAALSPTGAFVIQTFFASSSAAGQRTASGNYGLSLAKVNGSQVDLGVAGAIVNAAIADAVDAVCFAFREEELTSSSEAGVNADPKTGVFYVRFDPNTFQPIGSVTTISRKVPSALATYEVFNTTALLPDGTGIVFAKQKSGKLEFRVQPLNGSCGPKKGGTYPLLQVTNPIIRDHLPLYGVSAAAAWCEQVGLC